MGIGGRFLFLVWAFFLLFWERYIRALFSEFVFHCCYYLDFFSRFEFYLLYNYIPGHAQVFLACLFLKPQKKKKSRFRFEPD